MSLFFRDRAPQGARRSAAAPISQLSGGQLAALFGGTTSSYAEVNLSSAESNLQSIAVHSSTDLIASLASELPVHVYEGQRDARRQLTMPSYLEDPAGDGTGLPDWCYQVLMSWLLRGNLYGDILDTSPSGFPTQVSLFHPDKPQGWIDRAGVAQWSIDGKPVELERFLHRRVNPMPGRVKGLSPIEFHANQIGLTLTATRFGLQWFRDGAHPSGMLVNSQADLDADQIKKAKQAFMKAVFGSREPLVMGNGWEYKTIQVSPEDSQFLETQGYTEAQCARMFGPGIAEVLGYESGGSLTYSNVESRSAHLLVYSLNKWLRRLERLLTQMLPRGQYARIDRDGLLQSTTLERYRAHESALRSNWKRINEVRGDEDLAPVPWGDEPYTAAPVAPHDPTNNQPTGAEAPKKDGT